MLELSSKAIFLIDKGTNVGDKLSKWRKILTNVPQGPILSLFDSFINDLCLFIETTTLCNY